MADSERKRLEKLFQDVQDSMNEACDAAEDLSNKLASVDELIEDFWREFDILLDELGIEEEEED